MKKYLIVPGNVTSENDGQRHFVSATQLMLLYKVKLSECVVLSGRLEYGFKRLSGTHQDLTVLMPRRDGNYSLN